MRTNVDGNHSIGASLEHVRKTLDFEMDFWRWKCMGEIPI